MNSDIESKIWYKQKAKELVSKMTLEEKAGLCSGKDCWNLKSVERLSLPAITLMDGPHGLRKQIGTTDNLGIGESIPAICFPTASAIACSFDRDLVYQVGKAIGEECVDEQVDIILGPGINQKRSPLCGRNFEYYSEDPTLSGELGASMIKGVQSTGTGASLKHFAVNNQEKRRMTVNAVVDERTLRETYLKAFEIAVKKGKPDTVMCSYNRLNGVYCSENEYLLTDILRKEWGFDGAVVSDWGAVNNRVLGIKAGLDIEMPGNHGFNDKKIIAAVNNHTLSKEALDQVACRVTELILKHSRDKKKEYSYDKMEHHQLAEKASEQSAVLLKNEGNLLPGNTLQKAAVIGAFAKMPRYQGTGSSKINPIRIENSWDSFLEYGLEAEYAPGYSLKANNMNPSIQKQELNEQENLISEACEIARDKDIVYLFAGLPEGYESEGFDRVDMCLPKEQNRLIDAVSECNPNVVIILMGGAPMELPWINKVKAVLLAYLGGEGVGKAITNLLLGFEVPCGKLAETWPNHWEDSPCHLYFPGGRLTTEYRESIYVGYRYYEKAEKPVLFPFGHGLSYVNFTYSDLKLDCDTCNWGDAINLTFSVTNNGNMPAREIALIFVAHENETVFLPKKELREFTKLYLNPGETKKLTVTLDTGTFGYYNTMIKDWYAQSGNYQILVGPSSIDCPLTANIYLNSPDKPQPDMTQSAPSYYKFSQNILTIPENEFEILYAKKLPVSNNRASRPYGMNNTIEDIRHTLIGKVINWYADKVAKEVSKAEEGQEGMMAATFKEMPFFSIIASDEDIISEVMMEGILDWLNGHYIKGLSEILKK